MSTEIRRCVCCRDLLFREVEVESQSSVDLYVDGVIADIKAKYAEDGEWPTNEEVAEALLAASDDVVWVRVKDDDGNGCRIIR